MEIKDIYKSPAVRKLEESYRIIEQLNVVNPLVGCVNPALLPNEAVKLQLKIAGIANPPLIQSITQSDSLIRLAAGNINPVLFEAGVVNPSLARFITEENALMQRICPSAIEVLNSRTYGLTEATMAASSFGRTVGLVNRLARVWDESPCSMDEYAEVSLEEAEAVIEEVGAYLPTDVAKAVECGISEAKTSDEKLVHIDWVKVLELLLPILLFIAGQVASKAHEEKEEALWEETKAYQQESLELQKEDVQLKQEILNHLKNSQNRSVEVCDCSESVYDSSESVRDTEQHIKDSSDSQVDLENQNTLQEQTDTED